jgi:hypothetical protein
MYLKEIKSDQIGSLLIWAMPSKLNILTNLVYILGLKNVEKFSNQPITLFGRQRNTMLNKNIYFLVYIFSLAGAIHFAKPLESAE